jgi:aminopeptidase N
MSDPELKSHVFDTIEYDKGASVIRMSAHFLGIDTFRRGLNRYLTKQYNKTHKTLVFDIGQSNINVATSIQLLQQYNGRRSLEHSGRASQH